MSLLLCSLRALFIALNDEWAWVRALAIQLAGRLAPRNPAYVLPALRNHLRQLLADMERSPDSRQREGMLTYLIMETAAAIVILIICYRVSKLVRHTSNPWPEE